MDKVNNLKMNDHNILMLVSTLLGALGVKEIWAIIQKRMDISAQKDEREDKVYLDQIGVLTNKIEQLEVKIQMLIEENTQLLIKVARMEEKLIQNAKRRVQTRRKKDEKKN